jgi:L-arabinonolactonase
MDCKGGYWAALYGGGKLIRVLPDGTIEREILLPVSQPTMPAFGGAQMKTLFVTSASQNLSAEALEAQPKAGALFAVDVDIAGHAVHSFAG